MNPPALAPQRQGLLPWAWAPVGQWPRGPPARWPRRSGPSTCAARAIWAWSLSAPKAPLTLVNTSRREAMGRVTGLGDLSHASVVFSRDGATPTSSAATAA